MKYTTWIFVSQTSLCWNSGGTRKLFLMYTSWVHMSWCLRKLLATCVCLFCQSNDLCPTCLSVCLSACLPVYLSVCLPTCLPAYLSVCLSACLSVCLCVCLPACLSVYLSVCLSVCLPVCVCLCSCPPLSSSTDGELKLWDMERGTCNRTYNGQVNDKRFVELTVTPDFIACGKLYAE